MKVLVSVPNGNGCYSKHVGRVCTKLFSDRRYQCTFIDPTWTPYEHNLNRIVKDLLTVYRDHEFWLTMDDDNPPMRNPLDLVELDKDIIGLPTPVWANMKSGDRPWYYNAMRSRRGGWSPVDGEGLTEVDAVGSGCMLIHRRVCEQMKKPLFMRRYDRWGIVTHGADFEFCRKAKRAGFQVHTHFGYPCRHFINLELTEVIEAFHALQSSRHCQEVGSDCA